MPEMMEMRASVASILYGPADDGYTMVSLRPETGERIVAAGRAIPVGTQVGDEITVTGRWTEGRNGKGPVFAVQTGRKALPRTTEGIERWLAKAKIPGIGAMKAAKLVMAFGMETIDALAEERDEAKKIVGRKAITAAATAVRSRRQEAEIGSTLSGHGVGARTQKKILEQYGDKTHQVLTMEPYRLIMDIDGVAFATADKIAQAAGLAKDAPARIQAAIIDTLRDAERNGHCAMYHQQLMEKCRQNIYVREDLIEEQLGALTTRHIIQTTVKGMRAWATAKTNRTENELARNIIRKLRDSQIRDFGISAVEQAVDTAQRTLGITLSDEQRTGAIMALTNRISVLTGGPGTGKTHTLRIICEAWQRLAPIIPVRNEEMRQFSLAAPTGKAAKRITETTGFEGKTIHRLLEYRPDTHSFERNMSNPLTTGMICIDESSMPDVRIANDLGKAWGEARILLIGDIDQLPSVGPGKVLADILASGRIPHTRLTKIFRQAAGSGIAIGAEEIRNGRMPQMAKPGEGELVHIDIDDPVRAAERIVQMYVEKMPAFAAKHGLDPASIQVLCPGHQSEVGTIALNKAIQARIQGPDPKGPQITLNDKITAATGDKVIQLENDYERNIYNGDTGRIIEIERNLADGIVTHVDFGGNIQSFEGATLTNLGLAYALSIHKSQGSEYQIVIMPITVSHYTMLRRTLIYTGTTRAKRLCVYVGTKKAIKVAAQREDSTTRITTLADAIEREYQHAEGS